MEVRPQGHAIAPNLFTADWDSVNADSENATERRCRGSQQCRSGVVMGVGGSRECDSHPRRGAIKLAGSTDRLGHYDCDSVQCRMFLKE